jgi:GDP-4-dehydro-6-deoxy-D-mannose reductase
MASRPDLEIHGTVIETLQAPFASKVSCHLIELRDLSAGLGLVEQIQPDHIYHLAAQAFVPRSFEAPWETLENNILAQLNVIQSCLRRLRPRMVVVSSAEIYGAVERGLRARGRAVSPDQPLQRQQVTGYTRCSITEPQLPIMRPTFQPFRWSGDCSSLGLRHADRRIEAGQQAVIYVGDLSAQRDHRRARHRRAYRLIMERRPAQSATSPRQAYTIQTLRHALSLTSADIRSS